MKSKLLLLISFLFTACQSRSGDKALACIPPELADEGYEWIIHLPYNGCSPCLEKTISFIKEHSHSTNLGVLLYAELNKLKNSFKTEEFAQIEFVKVAQSTSLHTFGFPELVHVLPAGCERTVLNASNLEEELQKLGRLLE